MFVPFIYILTTDDVKYSNKMINNYCCNTTSPNYDINLEMCNCLNNKNFICSDLASYYPEYCEDYKKGTIDLSIMIFHPIIIFGLYFSYLKSKVNYYKKEKQYLIYLILLTPIPSIIFTIFEYIHFNNIGFDVISIKEKINQILPSIIITLTCILLVIFKNQIIKNKRLVMSAFPLFMSSIISVMQPIDSHYNYYETFNKCCINDSNNITILNDKHVNFIYL